MIAKLLLTIACGLFLLDAIDVSSPRFNLLSGGLACIVAGALSFLCERRR